MTDETHRFGEKTYQATIEMAGAIGVLVDESFLRKCQLEAKVMAAMAAEEAVEVIDLDEDTIAEANRLSDREIPVAFCLNMCRAGLIFSEEGSKEKALDLFGLVRSIHGYILRDDYRAMFAAYGKTGASQRHEPMNRVKARIIQMYRSGGAWKNPRQASKLLAEKAKSIAAEEGARFTTDDVPARLYQWFLKKEI